MNTWRKAAVECLGTAALLATVVGSGIMAVNLSQGNNGVALLANAAATAGILYVLITLLGPISGAHFNPVVSLAMHWRGELGRKETGAYVLAQCIGALGGVLLAHAMFGLELIQFGNQARTGLAQWLAEAVATFGLLLTILVAVRQGSKQVPALVASYIFAAYWFTASTSFANPAVTMARAFTQSFAGIRPDDVLGFVAAQALGAVLAVMVARWMLPESKASAP